MSRYGSLSQFQGSTTGGYLNEGAAGGGATLILSVFNDPEPITNPGALLIRGSDGIRVPGATNWIITQTFHFKRIVPPESSADFTTVNPIVLADSLPSAALSRPFRMMSVPIFAAGVVSPQVYGAFGTITINVDGTMTFVLSESNLDDPTTLYGDITISWMGPAL